jgi:hypothetical protein
MHEIDLRIVPPWRSFRCAILARRSTKDIALLPGRLGDQGSSYFSHAPVGTATVVPHSKHSHRRNSGVSTITFNRDWQTGQLIARGTIGASSTIKRWYYLGLVSGGW